MTLQIWKGDVNIDDTDDELSGFFFYWKMIKFANRVGR